MTAVIRLATENDAEQIQAIYAPVVCGTATSFELEPPTVVEMSRRIAETLPQFPWLVCEDGGRVLGYAYASKHGARAAYQWSVDTSVYIHSEMHRRGIGRALYRSLLPLLAVQHYYNAYAGIALPNPGSVGLHEAIGFRSVGVYREVGYKLGAWHDVGWWSLSLQAKPPTPPPPLSATEARTLPQWQTALAAGAALLHVGEK
jgi:L-amino acid N-acyltransferase YncA